MIITCDHMILCLDCIVVMSIDPEQFTQFLDMSSARSISSVQMV